MKDPCDGYAVRVYQLIFGNVGACDEEDVANWRCTD